MNKLFFNIKMAILFTLAMYAVYYILLQDNVMHTSIPYIVSHLNGRTNTKRIFMSGLLPIYISMVIFGASMASVYLASTLRQLLVRSSFKNNP